MAAFILHHDKISQVLMHPSRMQESISINISEAGFEAMKNDPEYEAWVLNDLRTEWAQPDRWAALMWKHHERYIRRTGGRSEVQPFLRAAEELCWLLFWLL